ncbi:MAG: glycine zipper domain-containing protein [Planctomycetota bacterium]|jgi:outer membrane lipoprotein SlyB
MKPARFSTRSLVVRTIAVACLWGPALALGGCNDAQAGALLGAGIGALAGQAIGRDTEATVIGTAVGAGAGYVIGNESDKAKQRRYDRY